MKRLDVFWLILAVIVIGLWLVLVAPHTPMPL
jgi:hypothetical protein